jgi:hypothetical protein
VEEKRNIFFEGARQVLSDLPVGLDVVACGPAEQRDIGVLCRTDLGCRYAHAGYSLASPALANIHLMRLPFIITTVASAESRRLIAMKSFICPQILSPLLLSAGFRFKGSVRSSR